MVRNGPGDYRKLEMIRGERVNDREGIRLADKAYYAWHARRDEGEGQEIKSLIHPAEGTSAYYPQQGSGGL
jgi:hypothetical protein